MINTQFKVLGPYRVNREQRERFMYGELWQQWSKEYPQIFDEKDQEFAGKFAYDGRGFYEWLAAVTMYETKGYLSLVDYYQFKTHARKNRLFQQFVGPNGVALARSTHTYFPDLLVYKPDLTDWYFVEAKGPGDFLRPSQEVLFPQVIEVTGKSIYLMEFVWS